MPYLTRVLCVFSICLPVACKPRSQSFVASTDQGDGRDLPRDLATGAAVPDIASMAMELEVSDCTFAACESADLASVTPENVDQQIAMDLGIPDLSSLERREEGLALADSGANGSVDGALATAKGLLGALKTGGTDSLRAVSSLVTVGNVVSQFDGATKVEKIAHLKVALRTFSELDGLAQKNGQPSVLSPEFTAWLAKNRKDLARATFMRAILDKTPDSPTDAEMEWFFDQTDASLGFFRDNFIATDVDGRIQILEAMLDAVPSALLEENTQTNALSSLSDAQVTALFQAADRFAGADGFLNRGDVVRILPVIPRLANEVGDRLIHQGVAEGVAQLAAEHPGVYRRWVRRPNGLIGRAVNKKMASAMAQAETAKLKAVQDVAAQSQAIFETIMTKAGVKRFYLDLDSPKNFWDPAPELTTSELRALTTQLTGMSVEAIAKKSMTGRSPKSPINAQELERFASRLDFPDGIPVSEVQRLFGQYRQGRTVDLPSGIDFGLGRDGKIAMTAHRYRCECYFEPKVDACIMTFLDRRENVVRYFAADGKALDGTCDNQTHCAATFSKPGRTTDLMRACGSAYRHRATGKVYVYR